MLQAIREKAQGWIAWAIVILISIPFALWGIQEYLGVGAEPEAAEVNGEVITERVLDQRVRDVRESMRLSLGDAYRADLFEEQALKRQVLDEVIEEMLLADRASSWNLRASDAQARGLIASIPAFQRDGRFDQQMYEAAVRNRGMSRAGFEQNVRQDLVLSQLRSGIRDTAFVTERDLAQRARLREQRRSFGYATVPAESFAREVDVQTDALRSYYEANQDRYRTPERVRLEYVLLDAGRLGQMVEVDEDALRQYFDSHRAEFVAREERAMRHILIATPPGADDAGVEQARARAAALREELQQGADFAALAEQHSEDPGSAQDGGNLGWVERGVMVPAFEEAAFALARGAVSEPVRTDFGFHLIQVTDVRGGSDAGFEDLRDEVDAAYRRFEAENLYFDYAERLAETAYENSASLTPAAETLGLQVQTTGWLTRDGGLLPPLDSPRVIDAAFGDDVLIEGHNSELIELGPQAAVVVRVAVHEPAGTLDFDANRETIERDYRQAQMSQLAEAAGRDALQTLQASGGSLQSIAAARGWGYEQVDEVGRDAVQPAFDIVAEAFSLSPPNGEGAVYGGMLASDGDFVLIELASVAGGELDKLPETERELLTQQAAGQVANAQMDYFTESLRQRADIEVKLRTEQ